MHLRLAILAMKVKVSRFLYLAFSIFTVLVAQSIVNQFSMSLLGVHLGLAVWILVGVWLVLSVVVHARIGSEFSENDNKYFDLNEYKSEIKHNGDLVYKIKLKRFLDCVKDVFGRAGLSTSELQVFVARENRDPKLTEEQRKVLPYNIFHTGIGNGKVIQVPAEAVMSDDIDQEQLSYVMAHEIGHGVGQGVLHAVVVSSFGVIARKLLKFFVLASIVLGIFTGSWSMFSMIIGIFLLNTLLSNLTDRYEELRADAYANSLGYFKGGERLFEQMTRKEIGMIPSYLELLVNHPTHENRLRQLYSLENDDQGKIPDVVEKFLYGTLAMAVGFGIYTIAPAGMTLLVLLAYIGAIGSFLGLCNSEIVPDTVFHHLHRAFNLVVVLCTAFVVNSMFVVPGFILWVVIASAVFVFLESFFSRSGDFFNLLAGYLETLIFLLQLMVLFQALGLISVFLPRLL